MVPKPSRQMEKAWKGFRPRSCPLHAPRRPANSPRLLPARPHGNAPGGPRRLILAKSAVPTHVQSRHGPALAPQDAHERALLPRVFIAVRARRRRSATQSPRRRYSGRAVQKHQPRDAQPLAALAVGAWSAQVTDSRNSSAEYFAAKIARKVVKWREMRGNRLNKNYKRVMKYSFWIFKFQGENNKMYK